MPDPHPSATSAVPMPLFSAQHDSEPSAATDPAAGNQLPTFLSAAAHQDQP
ncbi:hypothetical protein ACFXK0_22755 [Nocardia sp. NPDC059177]|uniref:hypothetical protein n=1 Tax=Nocardia sp. NPDC059177 TaxID=3346759 RepID=UPI0036A2712B